MEDSVDSRNSSHSGEGSTRTAGDNPFLRFAFPPADKSPTLYPFLGKRKHHDDADSNSDTQKARKGPSVSGSKRVKVYDHLQGIEDHLEPGLDVIFCGIKFQDNNPQRLVTITATPRITFGAAFMSQVLHHES